MAIIGVLKMEHPFSLKKEGFRLAHLRLRVLSGVIQPIGKPHGSAGLYIPAAFRGPDRTCRLPCRLLCRPAYSPSARPQGVLLMLASFRPWRWEGMTMMARIQAQGSYLSKGANLSDTWASCLAHSPRQLLCRPTLPSSEQPDRVVAIGPAGSSLAEFNWSSECWPPTSLTTPPSSHPLPVWPRSWLLPLWALSAVLDTHLDQVERCLPCLGAGRHEARLAARQMLAYEIWDEIKMFLETRKTQGLGISGTRFSTYIRAGRGLPHRLVQPASPAIDQIAVEPLLHNFQVIEGGKAAYSLSPPPPHHIIPPPPRPRWWPSGSGIDGINRCYYLQSPL